MTLPIVVTHPSTLFHNGLRHLFAKSRFRPVRISSSLTEDLQKYLEVARELRVVDRRRRMRVLHQHAFCEKW